MISSGYPNGLVRISESSESDCIRPIYVVVENTDRGLRLIKAFYFQADAVKYQAKLTEEQSAGLFQVYSVPLED